MSITGQEAQPLLTIPTPAALLCRFAHPFHGTTNPGQPTQRAEAEQSRLSPCKGPPSPAGVVFPFLGGRWRRCQELTAGVAQPQGQRRLPTVSARRRREGRGEDVQSLLWPSPPHPQGSFYTLEKLGSSLSSSPTDCSCCCRCSDLADHVARGDLGAARGGWELLVPARAGDTGDTGGRGGSTAMDFCLLTLSSPSVHPFRELAHALTS